MNNLRRRGLKFQAPPFISVERFEYFLVKAETLKPPSFGGSLRACLSFTLAMLLFIVGSSPVFQAFAQTATPPRPEIKPEDRRASPAEVELRKRLEAAQAAQRSGGAAAVAQANERLIALALREI